MSNDLLFSILPREGKVPIAHDSQKVAQIDKQESLRALSDEEKELKGEEREAREKQQNKKNQDNKKDDNSKQSEVIGNDPNKKPKGPKHLDIYV